jgi:hypothetical protein
MTVFKNTHEEIPPIGDMLIFLYQGEIDIGYLCDIDGSTKPRKWTWYSYTQKKHIQDLIEWWYGLPEDNETNE